MLDSLCSSVSGGSKLALINGVQTNKNHPRVLVVDDEANVLETMIAVLEDDFDVYGCTSPVEALALLGRERYHVVVVDWQMPRMTGVQFLHEVFALPYPIMGLLVTGHVEALFQNEEWGEERRFGLVRKPVDPFKLVERVQHLATLCEMKRSMSATRRELEGLADLRSANQG